MGTKRKPAVSLSSLLMLAIVLTGIDNHASADIFFPDFSTTGGLDIVSDAQIVDDRLRIAPAASYTLGAAWFNEKQSVYGGFQTTFQFQLTDQGGDTDPDNGTPGADGFAFVIQNSSAGVAAIGVLPNPGYDGIENSVAVEFDTFTNSGNMNDPNGNHLSVHTRGLLPNDLHEDFSIAATTNIPWLKDGAVHTVSINYAPGLMEIFIDDLVTPVLVVSIDLAATLNLDGGRAWVGYTAGTGAAYENHDILNWAFYSQGPQSRVESWQFYR